MRNSAFLALAAVGALVGYNAQAQGPVYSVNIVGFQKVSVTNTLTQISNPFVKPSHTIDSVIGDQLTGGDSLATSDNILVWNGAGYNRYLKLAGIGDPQYDGHWFDEDTNPPADNLDLGKGVWVKKNNGDSTIVMVGDVQMAATVAIQLNPGLNMVSYPYSTSAKLNPDGDPATADLLLDNTAGVLAGESLITADNVSFWNGNGYDVYFLLGDVGDPQYNFKWVDEDTNVIDLTIEPGTSFWFKRNGATPITWTATKPY